MKRQKTTKLNPKKFALSASIIISAMTFATTLVASLKIITFPTLTSIILDMYGLIGYSVSTFGAFLGALYIFIDTFIIAFIFAWLYNKLL